MSEANEQVAVLTPLPDQTEETYDQIMGINVKDVWLSLKHEIPAMLKTGGRRYRQQLCPSSSINTLKGETYEDSAIHS